MMDHPIKDKMISLNKHMIINLCIYKRDCFRQYKNICRFLHESTTIEKM